MDFRDYTQEHGISGERGAALFMAMMFLVLLMGFSMLMFENAMLEKMIAGQVKREVVSLAMADAGIEQALSWFDLPDTSPDADFFQGNRCVGIPERIFSAPAELGEGMGGEGHGASNTMAVTVSQSKQSDKRCKIQINTNRGKGAEVEVEQNPMPKIPYAAQGLDNPDTNALTIKNIAVKIRGETDKPSDTDRIKGKASQLNSDEIAKLKSFIKRFGRYFTADRKDCLIEQGLNDCQEFKTLFSRDANAQQERYELVFIEAAQGGESFAIEIAPGNYKGYFYFKGNILLKGDRTAGKNILEKNLSDIDLDGLFYTTGRMTVNNAFNIYGAIYAGEGFHWQGDCVQDSSPPCLTVWYNDTFQSAQYDGIVPMIRVPGTWRAWRDM